MSANFENKKLVVEEIKAQAKDAKSIVLVDYKSQRKDINELKSKLG